MPCMYGQERRRKDMYTGSNLDKNQKKKSESDGRLEMNVE